jgi:heat shock protein HslJ
MKLFVSIFTLFLAVMSCQDENQAQKETWWINSAKVDCTGVGPMSCFHIQKGEEIKDGEWELFYDQIAGFEYEPGFIYELEVGVSKKTDPVPADASSLTYELIEVISKTQDPRLALTNVWKLLHVGTIKDPKSQKGEALTFELNGSQGSYFGETGCNSIRGSFSLEGKNEIRFGQGAATMMACADMTVETEVKKVLELIREFEIENNVLYLRDEQGQALMSLRAVD